MVKMLWWDTLEIKMRIATAARVEIYMTSSMRQIIQNKWSANLSFNYSWIRAITAEFSPYRNHYNTTDPKETTHNLKPRDITIFEDVMNWLDLIDSVRDRKILWWYALGISATRIGKKLNITRQTANNRISELSQFLLDEFRAQHYDAFEYNGAEIATDSQRI